MLKIGIILLVLILLGVGIYLGIKKITESANKINEEYEADKELLQTNYELFNTYAEEYNGKRTALAELLEKARYYEDYSKVSEEISTFYLEYDELINNIMTSVTNLDKACKREYMEADLNNMCDSYAIPYEQMINIYVSYDIKAYNELLTNYHEWAKIEEYELFTSKYVNEVIDHDKDGIITMPIEGE